MLRSCSCELRAWTSCSLQLIVTIKQIEVLLKKVSAKYSWYHLFARQTSCPHVPVSQADEWVLSYPNNFGLTCWTLAGNSVVTCNRWDKSRRRQCRMLERYYYIMWISLDILSNSYQISSKVCLSFAWDWYFISILADNLLVATHTESL